jgi:hypothetical protein
MASVFVASALPTSMRRRVPVPEVHDEFSYLLAGDTFAHGRMTNPPHPLWRSLEALHVIQQPTYQSKYPPAQGVFLALGEVVSGLPIVGVWFSAALMCAALCWMLQAWVPARWALLGSLLVGVPIVLGGRPYPGGQLGYWSQSYWGGAVAAIGGALLYGGIRRVIRRPQILPALACGGGVVVLAASRPYEGLVLSLPAAALLLGWLASRPREERMATGKRVLLPVACTLLLGGALMAWHNGRVTGRWTQLPFAEYSSQYSVAPIFAWQRPSPEPQYRSTYMEAYHEWELAGSSHFTRGMAEFCIDSFWRSVRAIRFHLGPAIAVATALMLPWIVREPWGLFAVAVCLTELVGSSMTAFYHEHYVAPMAAMLALVGVQGLRRWAALTIRRWPTGHALVLLLLFATFAFLARQWMKELREDSRSGYAWALERANLVKKLTSDGGKHLIVVRYGPHHNVHADRIANAADIDASPVVWAREMNPEQNAKLLEYFRDRHIWLLYVDDDNEPSILSTYALSR